MPRWIWVLTAIIVSTSVYFTIRYGLRPKPIPVMNATRFENLHQVGVVIYKRLRQNIRSERVVLLGSSGDVAGDQQIWAGLLEAAAAEKNKVVLFPQADLATVMPSNAYETIPFTAESVRDGQVLSQIKAKSNAGHLIVVYGHTPETSHLVKGSLSQIVDKAIGHPVLSISTVRLAVNPDEVEALKCLDPKEDDPDGTRRLGCASVRVARKYLKKKLDPAKIWAVMERHGLKEYLLFVHLPQ